jgi:hypothetical protein
MLNDHCHRVTTQLQSINIIIIIIIIIILDTQQVSSALEDVPVPFLITTKSTKRAFLRINTQTSNKIDTADTTEACSPTGQLFLCFIFIQKVRYGGR